MNYKKCFCITLLCSCILAVGCDKRPKPPREIWEEEETKAETDSRTKDLDKVIDLQDKEIERQKREQEDLERQKYQDDHYRTWRPGEEAPPVRPDDDSFGGY